MRQNSTGSSKLKFVGLYLLSIALIVFMFFPFLEGNSTTVVSNTKPTVSETKTIEVVKTDSSELKKLYEQHEKSLTLYQIDIKQRENRIREPESRVQQLQQTASSTTVAKPSAAASAELENIKAKLAALEKRNATLLQLNNDLKKNNEYLSAQLNSKGK